MPESRSVKQLKRLDGLIAAMDRKRPYVWQLQITADEFAALEELVAAKEATPRQTLVYLAEWYKRCYDGSASQTKAVELSSAEIEGLWKKSGFDDDACAYCYEKKVGVAWEYSTYVLGGLAVRFEASKKDRKFLRQLCRLYYGEDMSLDDVADQDGRSVAFRQSIVGHGSLYHFIQAILNNELASDDALTNDLIQLVKTANDEVLRDKFVLEWLVRYQPGNCFMRRSLRLNLKPEKVGGKCHSYVRYERVVDWGVVDPATVKTLSFAVGFEDAKGHVVSKPDFDRPILSCVNAGKDAEGHGAFVVADPSRKIEFKRVPALPFARVRLWVKADGGEPREVYADTTGSWQQYWCEDEWSGLWSTQKNDRKQTAVLLDGTCVLTAGAEELKKLPFKDNLDCLGPIYGWCIVRDFVVITESAGAETTVYNHAGEDKVITRLYPHTICYEANGLVKRSCYDEDGDEESAEPLPIIFRKEDVMICHREGDSTNGERETEELVPDKVEFKNGGNYCKWTESCRPAAGLVTLRVTCRGREFAQQRMFYYPGLFEESETPQPIVRDLGEHVIRYHEKTDGGTKVIAFQVPNADEPIKRTFSVKLDGCDDCARVEVYAPFDDKEIYIDGAMVKRIPAGETFFLPYLLKDRVQIRDFGGHGYREYDCGRLASLYHPDFLGNEDNAALNYWNEGRKVSATELDAQAPEWMEVGFGISAVEPANENDIEFWQWVYSEDGDPVCWENRDHLPAHSIAFQNLASGAPALRIAFPRMPDPRADIDDIFANFDNGTALELASPYKCYAVATRFRQYFFIFEPLRRLLQDGPREMIKREILDPLLHERGGKLTSVDYHNLIRLSEEGRFDWLEDLDVNLIEFVQDDEERT